MLGQEIENSERREGHGTNDSGVDQAILSAFGHLEGINELSRRHPQGAEMRRVAIRLAADSMAEARRRMGNPSPSPDPLLANGLVRALIATEQASKAASQQGRRTGIHIRLRRK
ncbi:MAG TPA: hypothetical protein VND99_05480 [Candidatus Acidoferrales bacterium]|nr:hypothetical protein [Candidatus Acidoferrales bacterium]